MGKSIKPTIFCRKYTQLFIDKLVDNEHLCIELRLMDFLSVLSTASTVRFHKATKMIVGSSMVEPFKRAEPLADLGTTEFDLLSAYIKGLRIFKFIGLPLKFESDNGKVVIKEVGALKFLGSTFGLCSDFPL